MEKNQNKYKLSQERHDKIYRILEKDTFDNKKPVDFPIAVVLGGQPGSGKLILIDDALREFKDDNVVIINGDEYRKVHPHYTEILNKYEEDMAFYTDVDVRTWTSDLFSKAINDKFNLIFEGTMRTERICETLKKLKEKGFFVKVKALAVNGVESILSTIERYEIQKSVDGYGRITPADSHRLAYYGMINTLESIEKQECFDTLEILTRDGEMIYYNNLSQKEIYSKYDMSIGESLKKSREEQKTSDEQVTKRLLDINRFRIQRGEEPIYLEEIL